MRPACSRVAGDALLCLYQHRLMSTGQLQRLLLPDAAGTSYLRRELGQLRDRGLADSVTAGRARELLWFVTGAGAEQAERSREVVVRPYQMTAGHAAGPLREHTLAVNEVGIAFAAAARERGDTCGPLDWIPEVAHQVGRGRYLICDALVSYVAEDAAAGTRTQLQWFIELDRATMPVGRLARKLALYSEYAQARCPGRGRGFAWQRLYPCLPRLLVVLAGANAAALERRMCDLAVAVAADPESRHCRMDAEVTTLPALIESGPFRR